MGFIPGGRVHPHTRDRVAMARACHNARPVFGLAANQGDVLFEAPSGFSDRGRLYQEGSCRLVAFCKPGHKSEARRSTGDHVVIWFAAEAMALAYDHRDLEVAYSKYLAMTCQC